MATTDEVALMVVFLEAAYPGITLGEDSLIAYRTLLADVPGPILQNAAQAAARRQRYFPQPSMLLEEARAIQARLETIVDTGSSQVTAILNRLWDHFIATGEYNPRQFETLADQLERAERPDGAAYTRGRLCRIEAIASGNVRA